MELRIQGDQDSYSLQDRVMGRKDLYVERTLQICGGLLLSIQINSDQDLYTKKLLKAEETNIWRD